MASTQSSSFLLSAADVSWGRRECYTVKTVVATALAGKFYEVDAPTLADFGANKEYYVWFDDSVAPDPAPAGRTAITVAITGSETAAAVASLLQVALEAEADFRSKLDAADTTNETVVMEAQFKGEVSADAADTDTTFTIIQQRDGAGGDLGRTSQDGVEVTMETSSVEIKSDQDGELVLDQVLTGQAVSVSMNLIEMTAARWKTVVGTVTGDNFTPSGGTELTGYGDTRLYASLLELGGELLLHPINKGASDKTFDITLFKSAPKPSSINFSGSDVQGMDIDFTALLDKDVAGAIRLMAFGDTSQDVRV